MRFVSVFLIVLLAGCALLPPGEPDNLPEHLTLLSEIRELDGVESIEVDTVVYDDGRQTELVVELVTTDAAQLSQLVADASDLIDGDDFDSMTRELRVTIGDSLLSVRARGGVALDPTISSIFTRWLTDPRVASLSWVWELELQLHGDGTSDGSLVETIYSELVTDDVVLERGGVVITDPASFAVAAAEHPYSANRFALAREVHALDGVSECSFSLETSEDDSMIHEIYCSVDGDLETTGAAIDGLLRAHGLLSTTTVRLGSADDYLVTHEGSYTFDET